MDKGSPVVDSQKQHSWPKFKIVLIKKVGWKSYYCPSFFGHVIKNSDGSGFSHPSFWSKINCIQLKTLYLGKHFFVKRIF